MKSLTNVAFLASSLLSVGSMACESPEQEEAAETRQELKGPRREPPAEAFDACNGKKEGDSCTVKHGDREMAGKCGSPPKGATDQRLMCRLQRPEGPPPSGERPPLE